MPQDGEPLLDEWRQGDFVLSPVELPILAVENGETVVRFINAEHGVAIISQSCDLIRDLDQKPFVHVAALEVASAAELERARTLGSPGILYLPALVPHSLVVNVDAVATVQKEVVATWVRHSGCGSDDEQRSFAGALARHRQRFAFPDQFNVAMKPLRRWVEGKRNANSADGRLVRALREIRAWADDWNAPTSLVLTFFVNEPAPAEDQADWDAILTKLAGKVSSDAYPPVELRLATYDDVSAREMVESDRLDLDGLSDA